MNKWTLGRDKNDEKWKNTPKNDGLTAFLRDLLSSAISFFSRIRVLFVKTHCYRKQIPIITNSVFTTGFVVRWDICGTYDFFVPATHRWVVDQHTTSMVPSVCLNAVRVAKFASKEVKHRSTGKKISVFGEVCMHDGWLLEAPSKCFY